MKRQREHEPYHERPSEYREGDVGDNSRPSEDNAFGFGRWSGERGVTATRDRWK